MAYELRQMENMPELVEASVCITKGAAHKFLKALTSVHRLSLSLSLSENNLRSESKETPIGWRPPSSVPECLLCSIEAFVWIGYKGRQGDREVATFVLKNAACLKKATFSPDSTDVGEKYQMLKVLASVPTAASSFQLLFD
ncbi:F-box/FBD/LRR-repeat protein [Raphanus sativus]|nr:F-box/FBD/LRR-repeat protein [Raphanus sativus]